ncbi:MAG: DNA integrity scanning protein DisA nucleotide-binding domain protein, partial [Clostridia bacterium]|nr:DNA integrity scanning protein DisA nucleotide-binding domain protein [Clostridia bacterium]
MEFFNKKVLPVLNNIGTPQILLILLIFIALVLLFSLLSKNNASKISLFFAIYIILISAICLLIEAEAVIYVILLVAFVICVIMMFSTEIKRSVWNTKTSKAISSETANTVRNTHKIVTQNINEIIKALQNMSKNDVGAILVLSNTKIPTSIIDSGVKLDSDISSALIESIFFPKTPLHDGAIIIQNDKIQAAGCFLPLSQENDLPKELGTRHRAGIVVTEMLNVTSIIVYEET